jgi:hypothetical protein
MAADQKFEGKFKSLNSHADNRKSGCFFGPRNSKCLSGYKSMTSGFKL